MNADGLFGPTDNKKYYKPVFYHNKTAKRNSHKSNWDITQSEQYGVFKLAAEGEWNCTEQKGAFSIVDNGDYLLGTDDEVLGFFPNPSNPQDPWHGFPVMSESKRPSSELLDKWMDKKVINYATRIRIERGVL
jgi:hypothetical protein